MRRPGAGEVAERHRGQRRLADAGRAAEQHERAGHEPAPEHAVELPDPGAQPRDLRRLDVGERDRPDRAAASRRRRGRRARRQRGLLVQRVPLAAARALAHPARRVVAALRSRCGGWWGAPLPELRRGSGRVRPRHERAGALGQRDHPERVGEHDRLRQPRRAPRPRRPARRGPAASPPTPAPCAPPTAGRPSARASRAPPRSSARPPPSARARPRGSRAAATPSRCSSPRARRARCARRAAPAVACSSRRPVGVAERAADLGEQRHRDQEVGVARQRVEAGRGHALERLARLVVAPQLDVHQRLAAAPGRDRRVHLDEVRDRLLDLAEPALLAADVEHRHRVVVQGVLGVAALADRERLARQPLGVVEVARELGARAAEQRRPPQVERPVDDRGERGGRLDLDVGAGDVAELEQVHDRPACALQLQLEVADLGGDPPQLARHLEALLDVLRAPQHVVARVERGRERGRVADAARDLDRRLAQQHPPLGLARVVELEREPGQQARAQRRVLLAQPLQRLLEQRDDLGLLAPAASTTAPRRRARHGRAGPGPRARARARRPRRTWPRACSIPARSSDAPSASSSSPLVRSPPLRGLARAQRAAIVLGRLLPCQQAVGAAAGGEREVDRARRAVDRRGAGEVARELRQPGVEILLVAGEDRLADARVQPRAAQGGEAVVERRAHQRVGEGVAADAAVDLAQHAGAHRLVERRDEVVPRQRPERLEQPEVDLAPDHRRDLDRLARRRRQPPQPPRGDPAHALGHPGLLEVDDALEAALRVAQVAQDLLDEERVALGLAVQRRHEVRGGRAAPWACDQLPDLAGVEALERDVREAVLAPQRGDQLRQRVPLLELRVAVGAEEHRAPRLGRAHEVAQQLHGRAVGPVQVVEDEQQRRARGQLGQQRGERVEQALALRPDLVEAGGRHGGRRVRHAELRQQRGEVGRARAEPLRRAGQRRAARPAAQHLQHGLVGAGAGLVEAAVEHDRAVRVHGARELGGEPRLADPRLAREQHEAAVVGERRVPRLLQRGEVVRAAHERAAGGRGGERGGQRRGRERERGGRLLRRRVAAQQPLVERHQLRPGRGAELVAQQPPQLVERAQRLRRVAGRLVDLHQQAVRGLAERREPDRGARGVPRRRRARGRRAAAPPPPAPRARAAAAPRPRAGAPAPTARRTRRGTARWRPRAPPRACAAASAQRRSSSACTASSTASASASVSTHSGSGSASRSSARPVSASGPSARRSLESSELSAESEAAGACSGHSTSSSS